MMRFVKTRLLASAFTLAMVLHPAQGDAKPVPTPPAQAKVDPVATQMGHISVETMGKGDPVILIPGLSSPRAVWNGVAPDMAKTHRVYLVQVNGFAGGDPKANLEPGILDGIVADLHGYIARNNLQGADMIGHSMGGLAALMLAKAHPEDAGKLMLVDSLPYIGDIFVPGATVAQIEPRAARMRDGMRATYGSDLGADAPTFRAVATFNALKPASQATVAKWAANADPRVSAQAMYEDMTTDLRPDMAGIETPITLVYPYNEAMPKERADAFYRAEYAEAPHVTYVSVGDSKHFVMLDQPQAFAAAVTGFLAVE